MEHEVLLRRGWLSAQPASFQQSVLSSGRMVSLESGHTVFSVGDAPGGVYAIVKGHAAIEIAPSLQGPYQVHISAPGDWIGEISFFTGHSRLVTFRTVSASDLFYISLSSMEKLTRNDSENMRRFAQILTFGISKAFQRIDVLLEPDPARRIARILSQYVGDEMKGQVVLSQSDLGRMVNLSRNSVVRIMRDFSEKGWIRTGYGRIDILERTKLDNFGQED